MALQVGTDSYCDIEFANEYFGGKLYSEKWDEANETTRKKALKEACRRIDRLPFAGRKESTGQPLQFPRVPLGIPETVKAAQCEEALALLEHGNSARAKAQEQGVVSLRIGDLSEEYARKARPGKLHSSEGYELLKPYLLGAVSIR